MNNNYKKTELLAPAGSFDALRAAVNAGADAVYMGGKSYGARAYADNPDEKGILEAIEFCHIRGRKLYLTVNTLLKYNEISEGLYKYILPYYEAGLDAVIVQDVGVMEFIGRNFPGLDIHVSTQCSLTMAEGIEGIRSLLSHPESITRVVPARELSLAELKQMRENTSLEMEVFIHGALCVCYSGQCLLSSMAGGRSGNRGRCAQPCRRLYETPELKEKGYFLSPKDMCTLDRIGELIEIGIDSFKIEGRMKSPEYVAGTVEAYRKAIDSFYENRISENHNSESFYEEKENLRELYNRGGFNSGYLYAHNSKDMMSTERPGHFGVKAGTVTSVSGRKAVIKTETSIGRGDVLELREANNKEVYEFTSGSEYGIGEYIEILTMKDRYPLKGMSVFRTKNQTLLTRLNEKYLKNDIKTPVEISLYCRENEPVRLKMETSLSNQESGADKKTISVEKEGIIAEKAKSAAVTETGLKTQVLKLGNTDFSAKDVSVIMDPNIFVPTGELNRLRREAAEELRTGIIKKYYRTKPEQAIDSSLKKDFGYKNRKNTEYKIGESGNPEIAVQISGIDRLKTLIGTDKEHIVSTVYYSDISDASEVTDICEKAGLKAYFVLPRIMRSSYYERIRSFCREYAGKAGFLICNYEELKLAEDLGINYRTDSNIYVFNNYAESLFENYTLPLELNSTELKSVSGKDSEMIIYGLLPVMVFAQCVYKTITDKCGNHGVLRLKDEKGFVFTNRSDCSYCYNLIYNSAVLNLLHKFDEIKGLGCGRVRLNFTFEDENEIRLIMNCLTDVMSGKPYVLPNEIMGLKFTNGHFNRGVE